MGNKSSTPLPPPPTCNCSYDAPGGCNGYSNEQGYCGSNCTGNACGAELVHLDTTLETNHCSTCFNETEPVMPLRYTYFPSKENPLVTLVRDSNQYIVFNDEIHFLFGEITPEETMLLDNNMTKWNKFRGEARLLKYTIVRTVINSVNSNIYTSIQLNMKATDYSTFIKVDSDHNKFLLNRYLTNIITRLLALSIYSDELNNLTFDQLYNVLTQYMFFICGKFQQIVINRCSFDLLNQYGYVKNK